METSIMSIIHHPYLQKAISVHASPKMLYIISELATSDLSRYLRLKENLPSPTLLRKWSFYLLQAVACLHRKDIIHGDIKASNILLLTMKLFVSLISHSLSINYQGVIIIPFALPPIDLSRCGSIENGTHLLISGPLDVHSMKSPMEDPYSLIILSKRDRCYENKWSTVCLIGQNEDLEDVNRPPFLARITNIHHFI